MEKLVERSSYNYHSHITNNKEYLNFVKKNHKMIQLEKNKLIFPVPIQTNRRSSVFVLKDGKKQYKLERLTSSLNKETYRLKKKVQDADEILITKKSEVLNTKNQEISESMSRDKQSMSDIVYNYSKFRSMEHQYKWQDRNKKRAVNKKSKQKAQQFLKFPHLNNNPQQVFTIDYDTEGRKMVKVHLNHIEIVQQQNPKNQIKSKETPLSRDIKQMFTQKQFVKKNELHLFKKKKQGHQFGIEVKSINNKIVQDRKIEQNGMQLRSQMYQLITQNYDKREKIRQIKEEGDYLFEKVCKQQQANNSIKLSSNIEFKFITTKQLFAPNYLNKCNRTSSFSLGQQRQQILNNQKLEQSSPKELQKNAEGKKDSSRKHGNFIYEKQTTVYDQKIMFYRYFLFLMNLVHRKIDYLSLGDINSLKNEDKYRYYVASGNNSLLIKSLMKRRFWWTIQEDYKKAHFSWSQLKINFIYQQQNKSSHCNLDCKFQHSSFQKQQKRRMKKKTVPKSPTKNNIFFRPPFPPEQDKILTFIDKKILYIIENQGLISQSSDKVYKYSNRLKKFEDNSFTFLTEERSDQRVHNHLQFNHFIGNKKALFYNLKQYYQLLNRNVFQIIPLTFHIKQGTQDPQFSNFAKQFKRLEMLKFQQHKKKQKSRKGKQKESNNKKLHNIWIVKPGQNSNRGNGIQVIDEIYSFINIIRKQEKNNEGIRRTHIVQKYIENPLLYKGRKFDIRHFLIITKLHGIMRAYWYGEGYIRTSSYNFDLEDVGDQLIHLTNDAIQKNCSIYGKFQDGNKLSYAEFQRYLDQNYPDAKISFSEHIYPKMKAIATDAIRATYLKLDSNNLLHNFQIFGLDFMIDQNFDIWLIQVNTNPCLQINSKLLGRIIPNMLQHAFRLSIDVIFPPPSHYPNSQKYLAPDNPLGRLMYQLIFDQSRDGRQLVNLYKNSQQIDYGDVKEDQQVYQNEGKQIQLVVEIN